MPDGISNCSYIRSWDEIGIEKYTLTETPDGGYRIDFIQRTNNLALLELREDSIELDPAVSTFSSSFSLSVSGEEIDRLSGQQWDIIGAYDFPPLSMEELFKGKDVLIQNFNCNCDTSLNG